MHACLSTDCNAAGISALHMYLRTTYAGGTKGYNWILLSNLSYLKYSLAGEIVCECVSCLLSPSIGQAPKHDVHKMALI